MGELFDPSEDEDPEDVERYDTALGWDPAKEMADKKAAAIAVHPSAKANTGINGPGRSYCDSVFEVSTCEDVLAAAKPHTPPDKFLGDLWLEGELAVLAAESSAGKSVFGIQLADALARGVSLEPFPEPRRPQKVLFFDFELTNGQFAARYFDKKKCRAHEFSPDLLRASLGEVYWIPTENNDFSISVIDSIILEIEDHRPDVIILDGISYLSASSSARRGGALSLMKGLRAIRREFAVSILLTVGGKERKRPGAIKPGGLGISNAVIDLADTVFTVGISTYGKDVRYLKHLRSRSGPVHDPSNVYVYRIERFDPDTAEPPRGRLDTTEWFSQPEFLLPDGGSSPDDIERVIATELARDLIARAAPEPGTEAEHGSFVGFRHLGFSPEPEHYADHSAIIERIFFNEQVRQLAAAGLSASMIQTILRDAPALKRTKISQPKKLTEIVVSPKFQTYLKGP